MLETIHAFVGAFTALLVMAEITMSSKLLKYLVALVAGLLVALLLNWFVTFVLGLFATIPN